MRLPAPRQSLHQFIELLLCRIGPGGVSASRACDGRPQRLRIAVIVVRLAQPLVVWRIQVLAGPLRVRVGYARLPGRRTILPLRAREVVKGVAARALESPARGAVCSAAEEKEPSQVAVAGHVPDLPGVAAGAIVPHLLTGGVRLLQKLRRTSPVGEQRAATVAVVVDIPPQRVRGRVA